MSQDDFNDLPNDLHELKKLVLQAREQAKENQSELLKKEKSLLEKDQRIAILEEIIRLEKLRGFSSSSEKTADQQDMFNEA